MGIMIPSVVFYIKVEKAKTTPSEAPCNKIKSLVSGPFYKPSLLLINSDTDSLAN